MDGPRPIHPLQIYGLHHDGGNKSDLDVICIEVIVKAEEVGRINKGECEGK